MLNIKWFLLTYRSAEPIFMFMKQKRKNSNDFVHIGSLINDLLISEKIEINQDILMVYKFWSDIVGDFIADNSAPVSFKKNLLAVHVESSSWLHEFQFLKKDIIKKINTAVNKDLIKDIKFIVGQL